MVAFYLRLSSVAVVPLAMVFVAGVLTRAHRGSGLVGLLAGVACALVSMLGDWLDCALPVWCTSVWWSYLWAVVVTAGGMLAYTVLRGRAAPASVAGLTLASCRRGRAYSGSGTGWLESSRLAVALQTAKRARKFQARWRPERVTGALIAVAAAVSPLVFH